MQSSYIPWKGYFDLIRRVDELILYDDMQYTRRDWRNRNLIKTREGLRWLTIPVASKAKFDQKIKDTRVANPSWAGKHWRSFRHHYARSAHFRSYEEVLATAYADAAKLEWLSHVNHRFITLVCSLLRIPTKISWSMEYPQVEGRTERLVGLCRASGADRYLSGPSAKAYLDETLFAEAGIRLEYMDYSGYPEYRQLHGPFEHRVTVLDLILNEGPDALRCLETL